MFFVLYGSVVPGVFHWFYIGIPLVFWGVPLVFRVMFTVPPLFWGVSSAVSMVFRVPSFLVLEYAPLYGKHSHWPDVLFPQIILTRNTSEQ